MPALILMYHDLARKEQDLEFVPQGHRPYILESSAFRIQVRAVAAQGFPVLTVSEWAMGPRPERAILLTFDDGHVSNCDLALPILQEYGLKATFFVTAGAIGRNSTMSWSQIRALHDGGMEIGSHTLTHRPPVSLNDDELRFELAESRRILEEGLGAPVLSISSPTGFFNPRMCTIAREVGYRTLSFGKASLAADHGDLFSLPRIAVKRSTNTEQFEALLRFDRGFIRRLRRRQWVRGVLRDTLGPAWYLRMRKIFMGVHSFR